MLYLTDDEITEAITQGRINFRERRSMVIDDFRAIATAAVQKYQSWLAKQVGPKPCLTCRQFQELDLCNGEGDCGKFIYWRGQQSGYAKGIQEGRKQSG